MSAVDDLLAALDQGQLDKALDSLLGKEDKAGLAKLKDEMAAKADSISDQDQRHLFKNGIASIKMVMDTM